MTDEIKALLGLLAGAVPLIVGTVWLLRHWWRSKGCKGGKTHHWGDWSWEPRIGNVRVCHVCRYTQVDSHGRVDLK
jgi:hypothetical protein